LKKWGWLNLSLPEEALRYVCASIVLASIETFLVSLAYLPAHIPGAFESWGWLPPVLCFWVVVFLFWNAIYSAVHHSRRTRRAELEKLQTEVVAREAELSALHGQVNPHFLFNSLNSLRALIYEDPARADRMVTELANVLRYSLTSGRARTVPLCEELDAVSDYLALERIRFEERLKVTVDVPEALDTASIPPMLLQTLVENAIKHGIEQQREPGEVRITAAQFGDSIQLEVRNTGHLRSNSNGTGIGLGNARERLRLLYGDGTSLELRESNGWVIASIQWPRKEASLASTDRR
jgi:LytS/YehU family sensor histidine kinase